MVRKTFVLIILSVLLIAVLAGWASAQEFKNVIKGDLVRNMGDIVVPADTLVEGDVVGTMGSITILGKVEGNVVATMGEVTIHGEVLGDVKASMGSITLGPTARVRGQVTVSLGAIDRDPSAEVGGVKVIGGADNQGRVEVGPIRIDKDGVRLPGIEVSDRGVFLPGGIEISPRGVFLPGLTVADEGVRFAPGMVFGPGLFVFNPAVRLFSWLGLLGMALISAALLPDNVQTIARAIGERPGHSVGVGILTFLLSPVALIALIITVIGILLIPFVGLALVAAKFLGYVGASVWLGSQLEHSLGRENQQLLIQVFLGTLAFALIGSVPVIGALISVAVTVVGIGAVIATKFGTGRPWFGRKTTA